MRQVCIRAKWSNHFSFYFIPKKLFISNDVSIPKHNIIVLKSFELRIELGNYHQRNQNQEAKTQSIMRRFDTNIILYLINFDH